MIWTESFCQCTDSKATLLIFTLRFRFAFGEGSLFSLNSFRQLPGNSGLKGGVRWYWTNSIIQDKVSKKYFSENIEISTFFLSLTSFNKSLKEKNVSEKQSNINVCGQAVKQ